MSDEFNKHLPLVKEREWKVARDPAASIFGDARLADNSPLANVRVADKDSMIHWQYGTDTRTSAEKELGYLPELNFDGVVDENSFKDADPSVNEAINIVTDLRLKAVGKLEFTQEDKDRLNYYNDYLTYVNITNDVIARQEQERVEAQALKLVEDAEALLDSSTDENELNTICSKVEELVQKLGSAASRILPKLQMLKSKLAARLSKKETK